MPIDPDQFVSEDDTAGKFFEILVPTYDGNLRTWAPSSYLRLGAAHPDEKGLDPLTDAKCEQEGTAGHTYSAALGTNLALKAVIEGLDTEGKSASTEAGGYTLFEDDERERGPDHTHLSKDDRKSATAAFFSKLGWRDHTDGNRLTTTRGDKVEVIRGNYKLVVLGRQDTPSEAAGFDISGGDTRALGCVDAEVDTTEVTWDETDDCWCVTEKVHSGKRFEYFTGTSRHEETKVSKSLTEIVLASNIASTVNAVTITEATTAVNISGMTSASTIAEVTNALASISEQINAGSIEESIDCLGPINSATIALGINEQVNCAGVINDNVNAGAINEQVNAGMINEQTNVPGAITENVNAGMITSLTMAGLIVEATVVGSAAVDVFAGPVKLDVTAAAAIDIFVGAKLDFALAAILEIALAEKLIVGIDEHHLKGDVDIAAQDYTVDADGVVNIVGSNVSLGLGVEE